jgi:hypothetical protein
LVVFGAADGVVARGRGFFYVTTVGIFAKPGTTTWIRATFVFDVSTGLSNAGAGTAKFAYAAVEFKVAANLIHT